MNIGYKWTYIWMSFGIACVLQIGGMPSWLLLEDN